MKHIRIFLSEPYRLFFPLGFLLGFWGVFLWLLFALFATPYPGVLHSYLMIGGFLSAFTTGFLMTAVPRFTGTFHAEAHEIIISFLSLLALPLAVLHSMEACSLCVLIGHLNLILFFARRIIKRKAAVPPQFVFVPLSLVCSLLGHSLILLVQFNVIDGQYLQFGRLLAFYAFMLGVVLGVGSKIIPAFTGFGPLMLKKVWKMYAIMVLFFLSFPVQQWVHLRIGLWMRVTSIIFVAVQFWSIFHKPVNPSKLSFGLWFSCWGLVLGALGGAFFPLNLIQWNHVLFIFGFGLMTLMIGSRVILAHGGFDLNREGEKSWIVVIIALLIVTSLVRLLLFVQPAFYTKLLLLSSSLWLISLLIWWKHIGSKAPRANSLHQCGQSC